MSSHHAFADNVAVVQRDVQRKLGRCLIRLQQFERMMKAFHIEHQLEGPTHELERIKQRRIDCAQKKTLGQVIAELTESGFIRSSSSAEPSVAGDSDATSDSIRLGLSFCIELSDAEYERVRIKLSELISLRNELVHHFIERFDLWSEPGCCAADAYLETAYAKIDAAYMELSNWAKTFCDARDALSKHISSPEFRDYLQHGIRPDGSGVDWPFSTIVRLLQTAETELSHNGWTPLNDAIALISSREPTHTPRRYGCTSWRQVLHASQLFRIRREKLIDSDEPTRVYYCSIVT